MRLSEEHTAKQQVDPARDAEVTKRLATWASSFATSDLPAEARHAAKALTLDFVRCAVIGAHMKEVTAVRRIVQSWGSIGESTVLVLGDRTDPSRAALLNGVVGRIADADHSHVGSMMHPGAAVLPAAFVAAEMVEASGPDFLTAITVGFDVAIRIGLAVQPSHFRRGFESTSTCGVFGATAAVGRLMGLSPDEMLLAFGTAGSLAAGVAQFYKLGTRINALHAGRAAEAGILAVSLAREGWGGPRAVLEGPEGFGQAFADSVDWAASTEGLGSDFKISGCTVRTHSTSARLQATVQATLDLASSRGFDLDDIARIRVHIPSIIAGRLTDPNPPDAAAAQLSLQVAVGLAVCLARRRNSRIALTVSDFEQSFNDSEVRRIALLTEPVVDPRIDQLTTEMTVPSLVEIELADGRTFSREVLNPVGSPVSSMSASDLNEFFVAHVGPVLGSDATKATFDLIVGLDEAHSAVAPITQVCRRA